MTTHRAAAPSRARSPAFVALVTASLMVLAIIVGRNFTAPKLPVQQRIPHLYPVRDSAFTRAMGLALGPSIVGGNQIPPCSTAMRSFPRC
jgi:cardiolipin synthase A/B